MTAALSYKREMPSISWQRRGSPASPLSSWRGDRAASRPLRVIHVISAIPACPVCPESGASFGPPAGGFPSPRRQAGVALSLGAGNQKNGCPHWLLGFPFHHWRGGVLALDPVRRAPRAVVPASHLASGANTRVPSRPSLKRAR